jgi:hypothetical protein
MGRMRQLGYSFDLASFIIAVFNFPKIIFFCSRSVAKKREKRKIEHLNCLMHPANAASGTRLFPVVKLS